MTKATNSATALAIASLMGLLPQVLLSPFIGTWVDRGNRRAIMIIADSAVALATLVLVILFALGRAEIWHIYVLLFARAIGEGFHQSAFGASVVLLVPKEQLARVQGFNQALYGGLNIISAPLGAFLFALLPMQGILSIDISTALIAVTILLFIPIPQPEKSTTAQATFWQDFAAGFRYIIAWRGLVIVLLMVMVINFFYSAAESLTPLLISKHFQGDAQQLGWWQAMFATGTIIGGILLGAWGGFKKKVVTAQSGLILLGLGTTIIGFTPPEFFWLGLAANTLTGLVLPITNGSFGAILQSVIAPEMQGRVFAFIMSAANSRFAARPHHRRSHFGRARHPALVSRGRHHLRLDRSGWFLHSRSNEHGRGKAGAARGTFVDWIPSNRYAKDFSPASFLDPDPVRLFPPRCLPASASSSHHSGSSTAANRQHAAHRTAARRRNHCRSTEPAGLRISMGLSRFAGVIGWFSEIHSWAANGSHSQGLRLR